MTLGWAALDPGGEMPRQAHSFEKSMYVAEGELDLAWPGAVYRLRGDDYAVVPVGQAHALRSGPGARWLEVVAPQARADPRDTFVIGGPVDWGRAVVPDFASPLAGPVGHFSADQLPPPSMLQMEGYSGDGVTGIRLKMLIDSVFGAQHMNLFVVEFPPGGAGNSHDHPFEEAYVIVSGRAEALLDGQHYGVGPGDVVWTGVGGVHAFFPVGDAPVRWLEVQSPRPPSQHAFRFARQWEHVEEVLGR